MKKQTLVAAVATFFLAALPATAQRTLVSGTVKDTQGVPYAGGSMVASLSLPVGASGATLNGVQISGTTQRVTLDNNGAFLMQLPDNTIVQPPGTQWTFAVTESPGVLPPAGTGPQTCNTTVTISGSSQDISTNFVFCPALLNFGNAAVFGQSFIPNTYNVFNDAQIAFSVTCTNGSTLITTGAGDPPFSSPVDVGKVIFGVFGSATSNCPPQGQITAVTGAHSAQTSIAATTTSAANGSMVWGTLKGELQTAFNASLGKGCLLLPSGNILFSLPPFVDQRTTIPTSAYPPCVIGQWDSVLIPVPSFNYANCNVIGLAVCGLHMQQVANNNPNYGYYSNFMIFGLNHNLTGNGTADTWIDIQRLQIFNVWLWNLGASIGTGISGTGPDVAVGLTINASGATACQFTGNGLNQIVTMDQGYCAGASVNSLTIGGGALGELKTHSMQFGTPGGGTTVVVNGIWDSYGDGIFHGFGVNDAVQVGAGGNAHLYGSHAIGFNAAGTNTLDCAASGANLILENSTIDAGGASGTAIKSVAGCNLTNLGGNKVASGVLSIAGNNFAVSSETQTGTCAANAATVTFKGSYIAAPLVQISDNTSGSTGAQVTTNTNTTATIHCNGATDAFTVTVIPNPI